MKISDYRSLKYPKLVLAFFTSTIWFFYLQTYTTFSFRNLSETGRSQYFSAAASAILEGTFQVDPFYLEGWNGECLHYKDVCTGYYGIFPSLIRIPTLLVFGKDYYFNSVFFLSGYVLFLIGGYLLTLTLSKLLNYKSLSAVQQCLIWVFLTFSPITFLAIRNYQYEESILWGAAWLLLTLNSILCYLHSKLNGKIINKHLYFALFFALFALHSRIPEGLSALFLVSIVLIYVNYQNVKKLIVGLCGVCTIFSSLILLNIAKFGVISPSMLFHGGYLNNPERLSLVRKCGDFNVERIFTQAVLYFTPNFGGLSFAPVYTPGNYKLEFMNIRIQNECIEQTEYFSPISRTYFLLTGFAILGLVYLIKSKRNLKALKLVTIALGIGILPTLSVLGMTERYLGDFTVLFLFLAILGVLSTEIYSIWRISLILSLCAIQVVFFYGNLVGFWSNWPDKPSEYSNLPFATSMHRSSGK